MKRKKFTSFDQLAPSNSFSVACKFLSFCQGQRIFGFGIAWLGSDLSAEQVSRKQAKFNETSA